MEKQQHNKIVYVSNEDDWEGVYVNGRLYMEDHRLNVKRVFEMVATLGHIGEYEYKTVDFDWMQEEGLLPAAIEDVKWAEE